MSRANVTFELIGRTAGPILVVRFPDRRIVFPKGERWQDHLSESPELPKTMAVFATALADATQDSRLQDATWTGRVTEVPSFTFYRPLMKEEPSSVD